MKTPRMARESPDFSRGSVNILAIGLGLVAVYLTLEFRAYLGFSLDELSTCVMAAALTLSATESRELALALLGSP